jgi:hypothetical protein
MLTNDQPPTVEHSDCRPIPNEFVEEREMTPLAQDAWQRWWRGRVAPDFIAREVVGQEAIADLVGVRFNAQSLAARSASGIRPLPDRLALLAVLAARRRALSTKQLAERCHVSPSGMRRAIGAALDANALVEREAGKFVAHRAWSPATARSVAVELKLRSWQRAIIQARRYQRWPGGRHRTPWMLPPIRE